MRVLMDVGMEWRVRVNGDASDPVTQYPELPKICRRISINTENLVNKWSDIEEFRTPKIVPEVRQVSRLNAGSETGPGDINVTITAP